MAEAELRNRVNQIWCYGVEPDQLGDYPAVPWDGVASPPPAWVGIVDLSRVTSVQASKKLHQQLTQAPPQHLILLNASETADWSQSAGEVHVFTKALTPAELKQELDALVTRARQIEQDMALNEMLIRQNRELRSLYEDLNQQAERGITKIKRQCRRLKLSTAELKLQQNIWLRLQAARSRADIEQLLMSELASIWHLHAVRVVDVHHSSLAAFVQDTSSEVAPLLMGDKLVGHLVLLRNSGGVNHPIPQAVISDLCEAVAIAVDRLQRIRDAEELKEQWQMTFDAIFSPLVLVDKDFCVQRANRAFAEWLQQDFKSLVGVKLSALMDVSWWQAWQQDPGSVAPIAWQHQEHDYEVFCQRLSRGQDFLLVIFHDVTIKKRNERQAVQSARLEELGLLASSIAHELNNPLGGMLNFVELIKMDMPSDSPYFADMIQIEEAGQRCKNLIENMLGFARASTTEAGREKVDLLAVVAKALDFVRTPLRSQGIDWQFNMPKSQFWVAAHEDSLVQAMIYIFQNATEALIEGQRQPNRTPHIEVRAQQSESNWVVEVIDNGPGMSEQVRQQAFNPLFSTKTQAGHLGLGLTRAYQIIDEHGGQIDLRPNSSRGLTVKVSLPSLDFVG